MLSSGVKVLCAASRSPLSAWDVRMYCYTERGELFCFYTSIADVKTLTVDFPLEEKLVTETIEISFLVDFRIKYTRL